MVSADAVCVFALLVLQCSDRSPCPPVAALPTAHCVDPVGNQLLTSPLFRFVVALVDHTVQ